MDISETNIVVSVHLYNFRREVRGIIRVVRTSYPASRAKQMDSDLGDVFSTFVKGAVNMSRLPTSADKMRPPV